MNRQPTVPTPTKRGFTGTNANAFVGSDTAGGTLVLKAGLGGSGNLALNDGLVQIVVSEVAGNDVRCKVAVGGELRSKKGLNLPGIRLGIGAPVTGLRSTIRSVS